MPPAASPIDFAQTLKDQVRIDQVIAEYVPGLARAGTGLKGVCPFHKEKTPSFHVHPERGFYHCFGCGAHGDVIKFIQEVEKVDFMMALEMLARRAGLTLPTFSGAARDEGRDLLLEELRRLCDWAEGWFVEQLAAHPRGRQARDYLRRRGLSDEEIVRYRLGYAPDGYEALLAAAARRGWSGERVAEAGLASRREQGGFIDRFRDRVMFPIADRMGQTVAFGGRLIEDREGAPKYINSAETPLFHKSALLYGVAAAREAIKVEQSAILLEGYMDWIAMHRRGLGHALAGMGTAFTEEQARLTRRLTGRATLLYDADEAGQKAAFRTTELLLRQGLEVRIATLPDGHDPDSFLEAEGTAAMRERLAGAVAAIDHFADQTARAVNLGRPEGQAEAVGRLAPLLLALADPTLREGYCARVAARLALSPATIESALARRGGRRPSVSHEDEEEGERRDEPLEPARAEQYLLYILLRLEDPGPALARIEPDWFTDIGLKRLYEAIYETWRDVREGAAPPADPFQLCRDESQQQVLSHILCMPMRQFGGELSAYDQKLESAFDLQVARLRRDWARRRARELRQDLLMILDRHPLGQGQLAQIDQLHRNSLRHWEELLAGGEKAD